MIKKYPVILDKSHLAKLITSETHQQFKHASLNTAIITVRKRYHAGNVKHIVSGIDEYFSVCMYFNNV